MDLARFGDYSAHLGTPIVVASTGSACASHWYQDPSARGLLAGLVILAVRVLWDLYFSRRQSLAPKAPQQQTPATAHSSQRPPRLPLPVLLMLALVFQGCASGGSLRIPPGLWGAVGVCIDAFVQVGVKHSDPVVDSDAGVHE